MKATVTENVKKNKPGPVAQSDAGPSGMWTVAGSISGPATFFRGDWSFLWPFPPYRWFE